ncbi:MAG: hypothetical protein LBL41_01795 [Bifidobacteriaceae bacterium]|jgi:hypothetical protein|nr:hypothetical protein [Bifidobacteriaceae bacterium]
MITLKKKLTGALMAFAPVASVLVGGVGAPEANAAGSCSFVPAYSYSFGDFRFGLYNIKCSKGTAAAFIKYRTSSAINSKTGTYYGKYKSSGESTTGLFPGQIKVSYGAILK